MLLTCNHCGEEFSTQRDPPAGRHASTTRCPACGCDHDVDEQPARVAPSEEIAADGGADIVEQLAALAGEGEVHIHLHQD